MEDLTKEFVTVDITRQTVTTSVADLNTIAILADHTVFSDPYRVYTSASQALQDGFANDSYVYKALEIAFSQNRKPTKVVVGGQIPLDGDDRDYLSALQELVEIDQGWFKLISDCRTATVQVQLAQFIETQDKIYFALTHDKLNATSSVVTTDLQSLLKALGLNNTMAMYAPQKVVEDTISNPAWPDEMALVARCSVPTLGTTQYLTKQVVGVESAPLTVTERTILKNKGYTFYQKARGNVYSFGSGKVGSGEWTHIIEGVFWIKIKLQERAFDFKATQEKVSYTNAGITAEESIVRTTLNEAADLDIIDKASPISVFSPNALDLSPQQRASGTLDSISFEARMSGAIIYTVIRGSVYS